MKLTHRLAQTSSIVKDCYSAIDVNGKRYLVFPNKKAIVLVGYYVNKHHYSKDYKEFTDYHYFESYKPNLHSSLQRKKAIETVAHLPDVKDKVWLYHITKTDDYKLVITKNGTICELWPCGHLATTGEAVHPDELPSNGWKLTTVK